MKMFCQCIIVAFFCVNTFAMLWKDMETANKEGPDAGFASMFLTLLASAAMFSFLYGAGAMSELLLW